MSRRGLVCSGWSLCNAIEIDDRSNETGFSWIISPDSNIENDEDKVCYAEFSMNLTLESSTPFSA